MKKIIALFGLVLALAACADEPAPPPATVARALPPKIMLNVKRINLTDRSLRQPANSPYIDNRFSPTISEAIKQWAGDRLQAVGQEGQAIVVIKEATLTSQPINVSDAVDSWFTRQQGLRYTGHAQVSLEATAAPGFAIADATATRTITLPEHPTAAERQEAYYSLLNGLMKDLGQNLEASIQSHMGSFIVSPPVYGTTSVPAGNYMTTNMTTDMVDPVVVQSPVMQPLSVSTQPAMQQPVADMNRDYAPMIQPAVQTVSADNAPVALQAQPIQMPQAPVVSVQQPPINPYWQAPPAMQQQAQNAPSVTVPSYAPPATIPLSGPY